jgi:signal transduction histidine kinase
LQTKDENLEKEKELKSLKYIIEGEEKERSRLARELHDGVNGSLGAIKLMADSGKANKNDGNENIEKIKSLIDQVSTEVRDISHNLMPDVITQYGLIQAIESYLERIRGSDRLKTDFQHYADFGDIDNSIKVTVYRIVQELTRNIIKHSGATECLIQINRHESNLSLVVEDNGGGFDVFEHSHVEKPEGIGLQSIYSRINLMDGKIDIQSELNSGTSVNIDIPLKTIKA